MSAPSPGRLVASSSTHRLAVASVLTAACLWGLSGTIAQILFQKLGVSPAWLVSVRMLASGAVLLLLLRPKIDLRRDLLPLAVFGILGLGLVQFTYFGAIAASNVATATFLQYFSPALVVGWQLLARELRATVRMIGGVAVAVIGTTLLALSGAGADISGPALVLGLGSAVAAAFYTIYPGRLMARIGSWPTTAYGFLLGGLAFSFVAPPWTAPHLGPFGWLLVASVVIGGTLIPFGLYLFGVSRMAATEAAVLATAEAAAAAVFGGLILGQVLSAQGYLGGGLVVVAVCVVSLSRLRPNPPSELPIRPET